MTQFTIQDQCSAVRREIERRTRVNLYSTDDLPKHLEELKLWRSVLATLHRMELQEALHVYRDAQEKKVHRIGEMTSTAIPQHITAFAEMLTENGE